MFHADCQPNGKRLFFVALHHKHYLCDTAEDGDGGNHDNADIEARLQLRFQQL